MRLVAKCIVYMHITAELKAHKLESATYFRIIGSSHFPAYYSYRSWKCSLPLFHSCRFPEIYLPLSSQMLVMLVFGPDLCAACTGLALLTRYLLLLWSWWLLLWLWLLLAKLPVCVMLSSAAIFAMVFLKPLCASLPVSSISCLPCVKLPAFYFDTM